MSASSWAAGVYADVACVPDYFYQRPAFALSIATSPRDEHAASASPAVLHPGASDTVSSAISPCVLMGICLERAGGRRSADAKSEETAGQRGSGQNQVEDRVTAAPREGMHGYILICLVHALLRMDI